MGWSLLEAMACGCAIVTSDGMPVAEVITSGVEGVLVSMMTHKILLIESLFVEKSTSS